MSQPKVLVTGSTGFIGRHLVADLLNEKLPTVAFVRSRARARTLPSHPLLTPAVIPEDGALDELLSSHQPDVIVHLATRFVARHTTTEEASEMIRANIDFGAHLAQSASSRLIPLVTASSVWQHFGGSRYDPVSFYASTKQALDDILTYFSSVVGLGWTRIVLGDTYGPGDERGKLLTHLLTAAQLQEPLAAGSGRQLWDAVYVGDVARAFRQAALEQVDQPATREYQLRPDISTSIRDVVQIAENAIGREIPVDWDARPDRGREMLFPWVVAERPSWWTPHVDLTAGIRSVWEDDFASR